MSWRLLTATVIPIGYPARNTGLRILDAHMQPVPPGVAGDLIQWYPTGAGLLGRPDLTASCFIADPCRARTDVPPYRDVARWLIPAR